MVVVEGTKEDRDADALARSLDCFTESDLCRLGNITESTAEAWRKRGTGPAYVRLGNRVLYPRESLAQFLRSRTRERRSVPAAALL